MKRTWMSARVAALSAVTVLSAAGSTLLWIGILVRQWPRLMALGSLCTNDHSWLEHCQACAPATALAALAVTGGVAFLWERRANRISGWDLGETV